jgi:hypothetical protein
LIINGLSVCEEYKDEKELCKDLKFLGKATKNIKDKKINLNLIKFTLILALKADLKCEIVEYKNIKKLNEKITTIYDIFKKNTIPLVISNGKQKFYTIVGINPNSLTNFLVLNHNYSKDKSIFYALTKGK